MKRNILIVVFLFLTIFLSGFLYKDSFNAYFFQDDWFSFRISSVKKADDFINFFVPRNDVIYFRPLGMQVPFFIINTLFGLNPFAFHALTFATHILNIILVFYLIRLLSNNIFIAALSSLFYAISAVHYTPFFWSATYSFVFGPTAFLLSFILFLKEKFNFSLLVFILGLLINEMVIVLPVIIFIFTIVKNPAKIKKISLYLFIGMTIFSARFIFYPPPTTALYKLEVGKHLVTSIKAYFLWSFNWPEELKDQFISFFVINPKFISEFSSYFFVFVGSFFIFLLIFYILPIAFNIRKVKKIIFSNLLFCFSWFIIGLLPVLFFSQHIFSYYLPISLIGLLYLSSYLFYLLVKEIYKKYKIMAYLMILITIGAWGYSTYITIDFNSKIHWAPRRAQISKTLVEKAKQYYPMPDNHYFIYVRPSSENKLALNDQDALKVIYNNETLATIYNYVRYKVIL